jgi:hypothetical protein
VHPFEKALEVSAVEVESLLFGFGEEGWLDFWLNPRRLRGSDFLMRWSQGQWSEERLIEAINRTDTFHALPYGPSSVAPDSDVRAFELYFERLEAAGVAGVKRPDLLIFRTADKEFAQSSVDKLGGIQELPFVREDDPLMKGLIAKSLVAIECENSLWRAAKMPNFNTEFTPQRRLGGKPGLKKGAVVPTVIIKEQDREPLLAWEKDNKIPVHVWHVFFDRAYGLALSEAERLVRAGLTEPTKQVFQAPGGPTTTKIIYKHCYRHAYPLGVSDTDPTLAPAYIEDKNGHILPYVRFTGGRLQITPEALSVLTDLANEREKRAKT